MFEHTYASAPLKRFRSGHNSADPPLIGSPALPGLPGVAFLAIHGKLNYFVMEDDMNAAAVSASSLFGIVPVLTLFLVTTAMIYWRRRDQSISGDRLASIESELSQIRTKILLVSTDSVPEHPILETRGYVESLSDIEVISSSALLLAEKDALLCLARSALSNGANAVITLRKTRVTYDLAGSRWLVSRIGYSGTAVRI